MQQSQRTLEEKLGIVLQTLKKQEAGAIQRYLQLQAEVTALTNNLKEQNCKLEAQKAYHEELRQQVEGLPVSQREQK